MVRELAELKAYDFDLPESAIAQHPLPEREGGRMLTLDRSNPTVPATHGRVRDLADCLRPGDLLVVNRTRVVAARLRGHKASGGRIEALLLGAVPGSGRNPVGSWIRINAQTQKHGARCRIAARLLHGIVGCRTRKHSFIWK